MKSQGEFYKEKVSEAIERFPSLPIVEIGVDAGTTAIYALEVMARRKSKQWFFTIDPYGDKPYKSGISTAHSMGYNDTLYRSAMHQIKQCAFANTLNHCHWKLTSMDFMKIWPQIEFWDDGAIMKKKFAFAFLDGDHDWDPVAYEFTWFFERMETGAIICIDDFNLLGGEHIVRQRLGGFRGTWQFNYDDNHYRCYFTKA